MKTKVVIYNFPLLFKFENSQDGELQEYVLKLIKNTGEEAHCKRLEFETLSSPGQLFSASSGPLEQLAYYTVKFTGLE